MSEHPPARTPSPTPAHTSSPPSPTPRREIFGFTVVDAAWVAVMMMALLGVALLGWFAVTLVSPTNATIEIGGGDRELVVKASRGQVYVLLLNVASGVEFLIGYEQPGAAEPSPWRLRWTAGERLGNYWFGGSLPLLAVPLLLPAALWVVTKWMVSRRAPRGRGFRPDIVDGQATRAMSASEPHTPPAGRGRTRR
jgi:hypothetical protein